MPLAKLGFFIAVTLFNIGSYAKDSSQHNSVFLTQAPRSDELKQLAKAIPDQLISQGITKLGRANITSVLKKIERITFRENSSFVPTISGTRYSAYNDPRAKAIVVNTTVARLVGYGAFFKDPLAQVIKDERVEPLLFHETLGASGVNDKKYNHSLAAYILLRSENHELNEAIQKYLHMAGGTTAVGGGGNDDSLWIKLKILELARGNSNVSLCPNLDSTSLVVKILDLNIEESYTCKHQNIIYDRSTGEIQHCAIALWSDPRFPKQHRLAFENFIRQFCVSLETGR